MNGMSLTYIYCNRTLYLMITLEHGTGDPNKLTELISLFNTKFCAVIILKRFCLNAKIKEHHSSLSSDFAHFPNVLRQNKVNTNLE